MSQPQDSTPESKEPVSSVPVPKPLPNKPTPFSDWKPLGTVRDSFYEQIQQDQNYR